MVVILTKLRDEKRCGLTFRILMQQGGSSTLSIDDEVTGGGEVRVTCMEEGSSALLPVQGCLLGLNRSSGLQGV